MTVPASTVDCEKGAEQAPEPSLAPKPLDKRVPREVWECIFNRLYPSQLCRLSMVNKNFNDIVSSLSLWSRMFASTHGPSKRLRCLSGMRESKSYMLYMCANSLHVCETCLGTIQFEGTWNVRPNLRLAPLPTLSTDKCFYVGEAINKDWKIRVCGNCARRCGNDWSYFHADYLDNITRKRVEWYREQH
ncbi:hypothetical protein BGZ72_004032 [Mortierella alpina]|nr:hypothetical protein BGZ72_004032 [Mortierella alpina]